MRLGGRFATAAATAVLGVLAFAGTAVATKTPTGEYAPFKQCQFELAEVESCLSAVFSEGTIAIGSKSIPVKNPITLQGGFSGEPGETVFYAADNGETLSKAAQPVPGGLTGLTAPGWWPEEVQEYFNQGIAEGFTGLTATIELAEPASAIGLNLENLLIEEGTGLALPVRIALGNSLLGANCHIGTNSEPIRLHLTTGISGLMHGNTGEVVFNEEVNLAMFNHNVLADETFAAPGSSECGGAFSEFFDPFVDSIFALPSASGKNSVTFKGTPQIATAEAVIAHSM